MLSGAGPAVHPIQRTAHPGLQLLLFQEILVERLRLRGVGTTSSFCTFPDALEPYFETGLNLKGYLQPYPSLPHIAAHHDHFARFGEPAAQTPGVHAGAHITREEGA